MPEFGSQLLILSLSALVLVVVALVYFGAAELASVRRQQRIARLLEQKGTVTPEGKRWPFLDAVRGRLLKMALASSEWFNVMGGGEVQRSTGLLQGAGFHQREALLVFAFVKTVAPLSGAAAALIWVSLNGWWQSHFLFAVIVILVVALGLSKLPDMALGFLARRRLSQARKAFPDLLELLLVSSEAGLGAQSALRRVSNELAPIHPVMANEMVKFAAEMRISNDRKRAYDNLYDRLPLPEVATFTQILDQSEAYGTSFAQAMRTLVREQRADRMARAEERAGRLPALMSVPLIFFIMPPMFVVLVGPAVLSILDNIIKTNG